MSDMSYVPMTASRLDDGLPTDAEFAAMDRIEAALEAADARGLTPSAVARKAQLTTAEARRMLAYLVAHAYAHATGNGAWTRYHAGSQS